MISFNRFHLRTLLTIAFAIGGCSHSTKPPASPEQKVSIDNFTFTPATITVAQGTKVIWTNHDDVPHTVTANDKAFASHALDTDEQFSRVCTEPGTYPYFCSVHPHMTGTIIVK